MKTLMLFMENINRSSNCHGCTRGNWTIAIANKLFGRELEAHVIKKRHKQEVVWQSHTLISLLQQQMRVSFITACKKVYVPVCTEYINIARPVEICILYFLWEMEQQKCGRKRNVNKKVAECNSFPELTRLHISTSYLQLLVDFDRVPRKFQLLALVQLKVQHSQGRVPIPVQSQCCKVPKKT